MNPNEATKIVNDEYAIKILLETLRHPSSVVELSYRLGIPIAECTKRIKVLEENRLVHCVDMILNPNGKLTRVYISDQRNTYTLLRNFTDELEDVVTGLCTAEDVLIEPY